MSQNPKANLSWVPQRAGIPTHMRKGKVSPRDIEKFSHTHKPLSAFLSHSSGGEKNGRALYQMSRSETGRECFLRNRRSGWRK